MRRRISILPLVLLVCLVPLGCGGSKQEVIGRTGATPVKVNAGEELSAMPDPLTLTQLARASGPARPVLQAVLFAQWGAPEAAAASYAPRVHRALGEFLLQQALAYGRAEALGARPVIVGVTSVGGRTIVLVTSQHYASPPARDSYTLVQARGQWRILYDTVLERDLSGYVSSALSASGRGGQAAKAAADAIAGLRELLTAKSSPTLRIPGLGGVS